MSLLAAVEEMSPLYSSVAFAFSAGGESWAADPSSGHFGEVSPEEPKEPWPVVSPGPSSPLQWAVLPQLLMRSHLRSSVCTQSPWEGWQVLAMRKRGTRLGRAQPGHRNEAVDSWVCSGRRCPGEPGALSGGLGMDEAKKVDPTEEVTSRRGLKG